jgi:hypothetical protein
MCGLYAHENIISNAKSLPRKYFLNRLKDFRRNKRVITTRKTLWHEQILNSALIGRLSVLQQHKRVKA